MLRPIVIVSALAVAWVGLIGIGATLAWLVMPKDPGIDEAPPAAVWREAPSPPPAEIIAAPSRDGSQWPQAVEGPTGWTVNATTIPSMIVPTLAADSSAAAIGVSDAAPSTSAGSSFDTAEKEPEEVKDLARGTIPTTEESEPAPPAELPEALPPPVNGAESELEASEASATQAVLRQPPTALRRADERDNRRTAQRRAARDRYLGPPMLPSLEPRGSAAPWAANAAGRARSLMSNAAAITGSSAGSGSVVTGITRRHAAGSQCRAARLDRL